MPVQFDGDTLTVATCDPQNLVVQDDAHVPGLQHPHGSRDRARDHGGYRQVLLVRAGHDGANHRRLGRRRRAVPASVVDDGRRPVQFDRCRGAG
ncbi:MAG: hypothetical protein R3C56_12985 [Pirellulaceae bacterium]